MRVAWLAGLALVVVVASPSRADEWSKRYAVKGRPDLHLKTDDGSVRIETGTTPEIEVQVTTRGWHIGHGEVRVTGSQDGDRVDVEVRRPDDDEDDGGRSISVLVRVPKLCDLAVRTGDGSIEVASVTGRLYLSTGDGTITAEGLGGDLELHTGDGSIRAAGLEGRVQAQSGDGSIQVRGRFDVLSLRTGDGEMEAEAEPGSRVETAWSLRSGEGDITLRLPDGFGAELDAHTGDGRIVLETPVAVSGTIRTDVVRGTVGPGGRPLEIWTGDGSIRLLRR
jgi:hypothetical protein